MYNYQNRSVLSDAEAKSENQIQGRCFECYLNRIHTLSLTSNLSVKLNTGDLGVYIFV